MHAPCLDALHMALVEIARPPDEIRRLAGELDHVLAGSTADLDHVPDAAGEMLLQSRPDRLVIPVKSRCIETAVGLDAPAVPAEFNDIVSQLTSPKKEGRRNATRSEPPRNNLLA